MRPAEVHKFGGAATGRGPGLDLLTARMLESAGPAAVVVVSAGAGVTDRLVALTESVRAGRFDAARGAVLELEGRHRALAAGGAAGASAEVARIAEQLDEEIVGVRRAGRIDPLAEARILSLGERWAAALVAAALRHRGVEAEVLRGDRILRARGAALEAVPDPAGLEELRRALLARLEVGVSPVVTGYCGRSAEGATLVFGRGGSDLSAVWAGAALGIDEVQVWKDVPGICTADPARVSAARPVDRLDLREAGALAALGARVIQGAAVTAAGRSGLGIRVRSLEDAASGTRLLPGLESRGAVAVAADRDRLGIVGLELGESWSRRGEAALERAGIAASGFREAGQGAALLARVAGAEDLPRALAALHAELFET